MKFPYLAEVHHNIKQLCIITTFVSYSFMVHAQGHGLCSNSGGFQLAKHVIETDPLIQEETPNLAQKLTSGEDLEPVEWDYFKLAYEQVAIDSFKEIDKNFTAINRALIKTDRINIVCTDLTEALDAVLTGSLNPADAAEQTFNSTEYTVRGAEQAASARSTDKSFYNLFINNVLNNYADCRVNGELLTDTTQTILHENSVKVTSLDGNELVDFINDTIPPDDRLKLNLELSPSMAYESFSNLKVGDGGIIGVKNPTFHFEGTTKNLTSRGHVIYFQRISPKDLFLFDTIKKQGVFIKLDTELETFSTFLTKDIKTLYREMVAALERLKALPEDAPNRLLNIEKQRQTLQDVFPFYQDDLPPLITVTVNNLKTVSHGPKLPPQ